MEVLEEEEAHQCGKRMVNATTNFNTLSLHLSMKMVTMKIELQLNNHK
jgi:hypothetical protein